MPRYGDGTNTGPWWKHLIALFLVGAVLFGLGAVITWNTTPRQGERRVQTPTLRQLAECENPETLIVAAAPSIADVVATAATEAGLFSCTHLQIRPEEPSDTVQAFTEGRGPDLWIPDSKTWAQQVEQSRHGLLTPGHSLATSPLIVASGTNVTVEATTWTEVLDQEPRAVLADVGTSAPSRMALALVATEAGDDAAGRGELNVALVRSRADAEATTSAQLDTLADPGAAPFPVDEATLGAYLENNPDVQANTMIPEKGTIRFDYPLYARTNDAARTRDAVRALRDSMSGFSARDALHAAGFRASPNDSTAPAHSNLLGTPVYVAPRPETVDRVRSLWGRAGTPGRQLVLVDTNASMGVQRGRRSPAETVAQGALAALDTYPDTSEMGLWIFARGLGEGQGHERLAPISSLERTVAGKTHRTTLVGLYGSLSYRPAGGSTLYETVWAGYEHLLATWQRNRSNALIVFTNGAAPPTPENEPGTGSADMTLTDLLTRLEGAQDPARPITVILVGVSASADTDTMGRIADATGGRVYTATEPAQLRTVFADATVTQPLP